MNFTYNKNNEKVFSDSCTITPTNAADAPFTYVNVEKRIKVKRENVVMSIKDILELNETTSVTVTCVVSFNDDDAQKLKRVYTRNGVALIKEGCIFEDNSSNITGSLWQSTYSKVANGRQYTFKNMLAKLFKNKITLTSKTTVEEVEGIILNNSQSQSLLQEMKKQTVEIQVSEFDAVKDVIKHFVCNECDGNIPITDAAKKRSITCDFCKTCTRVSKLKTIVTMEVQFDGKWGIISGTSLGNLIDLSKTTDDIKEELLDLEDVVIFFEEDTRIIQRVKKGEKISFNYKFLYFH